MATGMIVKNHYFPTPPCNSFKCSNCSKCNNCNNCSNKYKYIDTKLSY